MQMRTPSYHSDPHVTFLSKLLEEIREGTIQVPKFQRPLVWSWEDRLELLRSIRDGIPMGAVMVWRANEQKLECYENLGPFKIRSKSSIPQYLLDGVQRLSTLLGALSPVTDIDVEADEFLSPDGEPPTENFEVHYDFSVDDFVKSEDLHLSRHSETLPLKLLFDSVGMLRFQRGLKGTDAEVDEKLEKCDRLVSAFRDYKVPVIPIVTEDIEMATRTFQRLNSQGRAMSEAHMIHALSWGQNFDLNAKIREVKSADLSELGWSGLDDDILLKACKIALGFGVYVKNADEIGAALKDDPEVVTRVGAACRRSIEFLKEHCGISRPDLLPYAFQLVLITNAVHSLPILSDLQVERLTSWFWTTTYCEYFAGMSGDRIEKARQDLERGLVDDVWQLSSFDPFEVKRLNRKFDFRSVRAKAFAQRLAEAYSVTSSDLGGTKAGLKGHELLTRYGREALVQLLPRTDAKKIIYSSYANRFLVAPADAAKLRDELNSASISETTASKLLLSEEMLTAVKNGRHQEFVALREEKISSVEKDFYQPHLIEMGVYITP
ncbi:DUF262 domain-containing protein [Rhodovulum sulfidophilum]|uniref:DUF262 domain-containing protein n=1 Tax=Rhodovulum sulfidophilum TaxID=35806 RepID=UPI000952A707|nr:DUF262 domain-containing protein [Rhodovulum sulfidophilum]OLS50795.1 hypothetical protein BV392_01445 [Rhodovulum sulfidophilum]